MRFAIFALLAVALPATAQAQPCDCTSWDDEPGVLWTGCSPLVLSEVAALAAPALWFTRRDPRRPPSHFRDRCGSLVSR